MIQFWKWLKQQAIARHREAFLEANCVNLKCPHCNTWMSDSDGQGSINSFGHEIAVRFDCGQCKKPSYWVSEAGFWFDAEQFGVKIERPDDRRTLAYSIKGNRYMVAATRGEIPDIYGDDQVIELVARSPFPGSAKA